MDYLQYKIKNNGVTIYSPRRSFKPCYKWITFNTVFFICSTEEALSVLGFKPCYKWITFNTDSKHLKFNINYLVLNLVINGLPSILKDLNNKVGRFFVLNLVINGLPSIP